VSHIGESMARHKILSAPLEQRIESNASVSAIRISAAAGIA
jgi:hypothetical protein